MKTSHLALLSVAGVMLAIFVAGAVAVRAILGSGGFVGFEPGEPGTRDSEFTISHELSGFSGIEISGTWDIDIFQGDEWQVELAYPERTRGDVEVFVRGERLSLSGERRGGDFGRSSGEFGATIIMPSLEELEVTGGNSVRVSGFQGDRLMIEVAGATEINGENGSYETLDLEVAGASHIQLAGITFTSASVDLAGASNVELTMNGGELTGTLAGAGRVEYSGSVSREDVEVAGFGWVGRADP